MTPEKALADTGLSDNEARQVLAALRDSGWSLVHGTVYTEAEATLYTEAARQDAYAKGWADAKAVHGVGLDATLDVEERARRALYSGWPGLGQNDARRVVAALAKAIHGDGLERWVESLHEDANGLVWTTKAELRAALRGDNP